MDNQKIISDIKAWLDTVPENRDVAKGADLLLVLDGNRIAHRNATRFPSRYAANVEYHLRNHLAMLLDKVTHAEVDAMTTEAEDVVSLSVDFSTVPPSPMRRGLRPDHDSLPEDVRQLYEDAMECRRRISQCHMQARRVMASDVACKDSELYPWVKEIISLDKRAHELFKSYDSFVREDDSSGNADE